MSLLTRQVSVLLDLVFSRPPPLIMLPSKVTVEYLPKVSLVFAFIS